MSGLNVQYVSPKKVQQSVQRGFKRFENFRNSRMMFLRNYTGPYYDREKGSIGQEPLNLIFNAIRILVPHIVMNFPKHQVNSPWLQYKDYADLLSLTMEQHDKQIKITDIYRRVIVDAIFTLGIMKTGLCQSDSVYAIEGVESIDPGTIYTEVVDFDNFVVDPQSEEHMFADAGYMGDRSCVTRQSLLDSGLYKNDLIERLPSIDKNIDRSSDLSRQNIKNQYDSDALDDYVEIAELWVPSANAVITVPGSKETVFDDYLRVTDAYGPKEGPYTLLALTPPVPGNPLPVPAIGIWNDLHILANKMASKIVDQALRQKDVIGYKRSAADDAEELRNAADGEMIAMDEPDALSVHSMGGQKNSNEEHLAQLQSWFNMMAANPDQLGGQAVGANTATAASILQNNASVGLEDMKDLVYQAAAKEGRNRAWFFHTDPMIHVPLTKRMPQPAQYAQGINGPVMTQPPQMMEQQVILTPEARRGEFVDFAFTIEPESMGRVDSRTRFAQALDFATKVMPAAMTTAQTAAMLGIPFSAQAFILKMAKFAHIDWMEEVFYDPQFQMQVAQMMMQGPQPGPSKGQPTPQQPGGGNMMDQIIQNGQPANLPFNASPIQQDRQAQQAGAVPGQQMVQGGQY